MRKIFLATIFSVATFAVVNAQATFGIHAAGVLNNTEFKTSGVTIKSDSKLGWKVGAVANVPMAGTIAFMPQLNVLSKQSKLSEGSDKVDLSMTYVELPLNFVYNSGGFFVGVGPSVAFGIGGKFKSGSDKADIKFDGKKDATDDKVHLKALDFGGQAIAGYKLPSGLFFNVHYNLGFSNISPDDEGTVKNKYFGFGLGYFFGGGASASK
jgi:hypothetical protein